MKNKKYKAFSSFSIPLWTDSPSLGNHSPGLWPMRWCLLLGNLWDQFPDLNTPGGEHHQTFKKKSLHQKKKIKSWHVPYALSWHLDIKSATPNYAKKASWDSRNKIPKCALNLTARGIFFISSFDPPTQKFPKMEQTPNFTFGSSRNNAAMALKYLTFLLVWMLILHRSSSACTGQGSGQSPVPVDPGTPKGVKHKL